jgi:hypothetical protein
MMMNLRGLILDDPEHTAHLQALEFITRTNPDSETVCVSGHIDDGA